MIRQQLPPQEYGGVLVIGLLTLVLLTALGIAATTSSVMENEIAANDRIYKEAFYAAELALATAEDKMRDLATIDDFNPGGNAGQGGIAGHYAKGLQGLAQPDWKTMKWDNTDSQVIAVNPSQITQTINNNKPLRYTSELDRDRDSWGFGIGVGGEVEFFRITALGTGSGPAARVFVRSRYARRK